MNHSELLERQILTENLYSKTKLREILKEIIVENAKFHKKMMKIFKKRIKKYFNKNYHESKNLRISYLKKKGNHKYKSYADLYYRLLIVILPILEFEQINMCCIKLTNSIYEYRDIDEAESMTTTAEIFAICYYVGMVSIVPTASGLYIKSNYSLGKETRKHIKGFKFLPPMCVEPRTVEKNIDCGLITVKDHLITKGYNRHNDNLNYEVINNLQKIPLKLNPLIIGCKEKVTSKIIEDKNTKKLFKTFKQDSKKVYKEIGDNVFYQLWRYCGRSRVYANGYHINMHGNDHKRASIMLAKTVTITERGDHWLKIGMVNNYGNGWDKKSYKKRLKFAEKILKNKANFEKYAENPMQFKAQKSVLERETDEPSGIMVGMDCSSSGTMIMAAMTGCMISLSNVNLFNTGKFKDPPMLVLNYVKARMPSSKLLKAITRKIMKDAYMTTIYFSKKEPEKVFGRDTPELATYYEGISYNFPGVFASLTALGSCVNKKATEYRWVAMDGHTCKTIVQVTKKTRIEVGELGGVRFTHYYKSNEADKYDVSVVANAVHSVDALVVRQLTSRCNYNVSNLEKLLNILKYTRGMRKTFKQARIKPVMKSREITRTTKYPKFNLALVFTYVDFLSLKSIDKLIKHVENIMSYQPFEVLPVHDAFFCSPEHMDRLKEVFADIMKDLNNYDALTYLVKQLGGNTDLLNNIKLKPIKYFNGKYAVS